MPRKSTFSDDELQPLIGQPLKDIADHFGVDISTVSRRVKQLQQRLNKTNAVSFDEKLKRLQEAGIDVELDEEDEDDEDLEDGISSPRAPKKVSIWQTREAFDANYKRAEELLNPTKYVLSNRERIAAERLIKDYMVASVKHDLAIYNLDQMRLLKKDFLDVLKEHAPPELARLLLEKIALRRDRRRAAG